MRTHNTGGREERRERRERERRGTGHTIEAV